MIFVEYVFDNAAAVEATRTNSDPLLVRPIVQGRTLLTRARGPPVSAMGLATKCQMGSLVGLLRMDRVL